MTNSQCLRERSRRFLNGGKTADLSSNGTNVQKILQSKSGRLDILEWWKDSGQEPKYTREKWTVGKGVSGTGREGEEDDGEEEGEDGSAVEEEEGEDGSAVEEEEEGEMKMEQTSPGNHGRLTTIQRIPQSNSGASHEPRRRFAHYKTGLMNPGEDSHTTVIILRSHSSSAKAIPSLYASVTSPIKGWAYYAPDPYTSGVINLWWIRVEEGEEDGRRGCGERCEVVGGG
ncbi:hypothetical protein BJ742DRAFT_881463 [Cladochytrium replicatum]|nr:hypothetical protein BJ742DRAFT_881463 [Cladochytrium replicatum]